MRFYMATIVWAPPESLYIGSTNCWLARHNIDRGSHVFIKGLLGCLGDLVSRLSNGLIVACSGGLWGDTKWAY